MEEEGKPGLLDLEKELTCSVSGSHEGGTFPLLDYFTDSQVIARSVLRSFINL